MLEENISILNNRIPTFQQITCKSHMQTVQTEVEVTRVKYVT